MTAAQEWTTSYPGRPARTAMREPRAADCFAERSIARARARSHAEVAGLLEAAWRVLERGGWWGLKVDSVLREAQLSTRCFYRHFSSKNELLLALMEDEVRRAMERMERTIARQEDPASQVQAWVEAVIGFAHSDRTAPRTRMFVAHWGRSSPSSRRRWPAACGTSCVHWSRSSDGAVTRASSSRPIRR
jgi:AcrR family transcriptional regulator